MNKSQIKVGAYYKAKVNGKLTTVRVDRIRQRVLSGKRATVYDVTNLHTRRKTTFCSAQKFREETEPMDSDPKIATAVDYRSKATKPKGFGLAEKLSQKPVSNSTHATAPHLIVEARAGTGKTTTLVEGLKVVKRIGSSLTPSSQQQAVWEQMELSKDARTIAFVAFNKSIADELELRVPDGCEAMTMHRMGNKAVRRAFPNIGDVNKKRVEDIVAELMGKDIWELRRQRPMLLSATDNLVGLCKVNLTGFIEGAIQPVYNSGWDFALDRLAAHYDVDLNGDRAEVFDLVPRVLDRCKDVGRDQTIDFNDMIWLPVVLNLPVFRYDLLLVDEAQDLNRCQQALARKAGDRLILVGDPKQAIYGFAGADSESIPRMGRELGETERGCVTLPLTVTRRCGKAIVEEARKIVPDFEAHESNSDGLICFAVYGEKEPDERTYRHLVADGDMVLCRVNAPLVSQCFRFLKAGRRATIQGRDIGQGLISTVKKLAGKGEDSDNLQRFLSKLGEWLNTETRKENAKRHPNDARIIALQDRHDCLVCFAEDPEIQTVAALIRKIESIFTDDKDSPGIKLSSVHKAKGLESRRVFLLQPKGAGIPHPMARTEWERAAEMNILYVAITRARAELVYVS